MHGYTRMFEKMLAHPNIKVMLNTDYREIVDLVPWKHMVYTGPIDAFFNYRHGKLPYRSLEFRHVNLAQEQFQPVGTVNYPNDYAYTRISEFKHLTGQKQPSTSIVYEYPRAEGDPYYPVPRPENAALYKLYEADAEQLDQRHLRRPARDLQVLQHGPGRRPGAGRVQAPATPPPRARAATASTSPPDRAGASGEQLGRREQAAAAAEAPVVAEHLAGDVGDAVGGADGDAGAAEAGAGQLGAVHGRMLLKQRDEAVELGDRDLVVVAQAGMRCVHQPAEAWRHRRRRPRAGRARSR